MAESNSILINILKQKFQLKIYAVVSILKITTNDDLLRVYCYSNFQANWKMDTY